MSNLVEELTALLTRKHMILVTAESCTGGLLAATITHRNGASKIFERGFITYSNQSKIDLLGVPAETLKQHGAVSAEVSESMALGALKNSMAQLAISVTGVAGPDGGSPEKPVGLVYFGFALKGGSSGSIREQFSGDRKAIQTEATMTAIRRLLDILRKDQ